MFVIGQHQRFGKHPAAGIAAKPDFKRAQLGDVDDCARLDRIRETPLKAWLCRRNVLAKLRDDRDLTFPTMKNPLPSQKRIAAEKQNAQADFRLAGRRTQGAAG